jgi:predicted nucleotidyltransferase
MSPRHEFDQEASAPVLTHEAPSLPSSAMPEPRAQWEQAVQQIVTLAVQHLKPRCIWLFGSRARGTYRKNSDIDVGFDFEGTASAWALFLAEVEENVESLLGIDCVNIHHCDLALSRAIREEGKLIYERR